MSSEFISNYKSVCLIGALFRKFFAQCDLQKSSNLSSVLSVLSLGQGIFWGPGDTVRLSTRGSEPVSQQCWRGLRAEGLSSSLSICLLVLWVSWDPAERQKPRPRSPTRVQGRLGASPAEPAQ